jgi:HlyD family secretion protein
MLNSSYANLIKQGSRYPFRPGMTASVEILTNRKVNVLSVPLAAVTTRNPDELNKAAKPNDEGRQQPVVTSNEPQKKKVDKVVVFVNEKGVAKMIEVKTGISDYDNIEIISGLTDSTEVITGPFLVVSKRLKDGEKIKGAEKKSDKK